MLHTLNVTSLNVPIVSKERRKQIFFSPRAKNDQSCRLFTIFDTPCIRAHSPALACFSRVVYHEGLFLPRKIHPSFFLHGLSLGHFPPFAQPGRVLDFSFDNKWKTPSSKSFRESAVEAASDFCLCIREMPLLRRSSQIQRVVERQPGECELHFADPYTGSFETSIFAASCFTVSSFTGRADCVYVVLPLQVLRFHYQAARPIELLTALLLSAVKQHSRQ